MAEAMPDRDEEALQQIEANLVKLGPITNAMRTHTEEEIIEIGNAELYKKRSGYGYYTGSIWVKRNTR